MVVVMGVEVVVILIITVVVAVRLEVDNMILTLVAITAGGNIPCSH